MDEGVVLKALAAVIIMLFACVPSIVTSIATHKLKKSMDKHEAERAERDKARVQSDYLIIQKLGATVTLCEATARAVQRIPDAHCNGDMTSALEKVTKMKAEQKEFLTKLGLQHLYED